MIKYHEYSTEELERFRHFQRLSYGIQDSTAGDLRAGISEIEALPTDRILDEGDTFKQVSWFLARSRLARGSWRKMTPNWNHTDACNGVGVKFEEILVIDNNGARWLDDDLPHHRRWAKFSEDNACRSD